MQLSNGDAFFFTMVPNLQPVHLFVSCLVIDTTVQLAKAPILTSQKAIHSGIRHSLVNKWIPLLCL